jgi:hypothetical protein
VAGTLKYKYHSIFAFEYLDGEFPLGNVILDGAGNLYGTTYEGGPGGGVAYKVTP